MKTRICGFVVLLVLALDSNIVRSTTLTWTNVSGNWNDPANWDPNQVPAANDHVIINSGIVSVPADAVFAVMDWSGGFIYDALMVASNAILNVSGDADKDLVGSLTNAGTVNWTNNGDLKLFNNNSGNYHAVIYNLAGGLLNIQNDQNLVDGFNNGFPFVINAGIMRKSGTGGTAYLSMFFDNSGTVEADTGTISFNSGGNLRGVFIASSGAFVNFAGGTFALISGNPVTSGAGQVQFTSLCFMTFSDSITNFNLTAGQLIGLNTLTGTLNWSGGFIYDALTVASNAILNVSGGTLLGMLTNAGTVNWSGTSDLKVYNNFNPHSQGAIYNLASGLFEIQNDQSLTAGYGNEVFNNTGVVRKSAATGTTYINPQFNNSGTVEADTGMISFPGGYSGGSSANLAISLGGATLGTGYGRISFSTPLTFDGTFTVSTRNGYLPNPGNTFQVLSYPSSTGSFTCLSGLDLGGGILLQPQSSPTGLTLLATAYTTNASLPQLFINRTLGGLAITWPVGFPGWTLQSTTNLSSSAWTMVTNACGNQATVPITSPRQFFRLSQ